MCCNCIKYINMRLTDELLDLTRPQVMAIVNVTDDSFYDKSRCVDVQSLKMKIESAISEGASIIDIGGYSSRPNAEDVSVEEEWARVKMGLNALQELSVEIKVSIDTFRSEVARRAVEEFGEVIINDISAGEADDRMIDIVSDYNLPYVAMHMRGTPQTMQQMTTYPRGVVTEVCDYLERRIEELSARGVRHIIVDPGFGFAKSVEQNYELLGGLERVVALGCPVLVGLSRKSMIGKILGVNPSEALNGTTALHWEALRQGVKFLRVHDVEEARQVVKLYEEYKKWVLR